MGAEEKRKNYKYHLDNTSTARQFEYDYESPVTRPEPEPKTDPRPGPGVRNNNKARIMRQKRRQRARMRVFVTALVIIAALGGLALKAAHVHLIKEAQVRILHDDINKLSLENEGLKRNVDFLSSVKRIEQAALAMGMEKPGPGGTIYVDKELLKLIEDD
jgi:cell division protein FtsL